MINEGLKEGFAQLITAYNEVKCHLRKRNEPQSINPCDRLATQPDIGESRRDSSARNPSGSL